MFKALHVYSLDHSSLIHDRSLAKSAALSHANHNFGIFTHMPLAQNGMRGIGKESVQWHEILPEIHGCEVENRLKGGKTLNNVGFPCGRRQHYDLQHYEGCPHPLDEVPNPQYGVFHV